MIELLVVLALMILIVLAMAFNLGGFNNKQSLELAVNSLVAVVREVQQRAVTQQDGQQWGVRFYNAVGSDRYEVFSGSSYASGTLDKLYSFRQGIRFSEPTTSSTFDVVFNALTGKITNKKIVSLINNKSDGLVGDITLDTNGLVTSRIEEDVKGYWHLDEGTSTTAYDASGLGRNGTITEASWQTATNCRSGSCLSFDGTNDVVSVSTNPLDLSGDFSAVFWVNKSNKATDNDRFISLIDDANNGFQFITDDATQKYAILLKRQGVDVINQLTYGSIVFDGWVHLAYVVHGNTGIFYKNGDAIASGVSTSIALGGTGYHFGKRADNQSTTFFAGKMDEIRLYGRALNGTEILNLYNDLK